MDCTRLRSLDRRLGLLQPRVDIMEWYVTGCANAGGDDLALKGWDTRMPISEGTRQPTFTCRRGYVEASI